MSKEIVMVWDPLVRLFHWLLAGCFAFDYLAGARWMGAHVLAGSIVAGLLLFRFIWGFLGTPHARFSDFTYSPRQIVAHLIGIAKRRVQHWIGHNPAGGAMIFLLLTGLVLLTLSGMALYGAQQDSGPLAFMYLALSERQLGILEQLHAWLVDAVAVLVCLHLLGVVVESSLLRENLVVSMISGKKSLHGKEA
jgi:cytochrome b